MDVQSATVIRQSEWNDDESLIAAVLDGDDEAFSSLISRHQQTIYRTALAIVRDAAEAESVTHDTFVRAYFKLKTFEKRSSFASWLTRIAVNISRDALRREKRHAEWQPLDANDDGAERERFVDEAPDAERAASSRELQAAIDRAVGKLPVQQRLVFRLRHLEEKSLDEIAAILNLNCGTVRAHLHRALARLRGELAAWSSRRVEGK